MSFLSPLRSNLFRYRKRKQLSLDGGVAGLARPRGHGKPVYAELGPWGSPPKEYVQPPARSYEPHPGFAQFPEPEYEAYHWDMPHHSSRLHRDPGPREGRKPRLPRPDYDALRMTDELFAQAMRGVNNQLEPIEQVRIDHDVMLQGILNGNPPVADSVADQDRLFRQAEGAFDRHVQQVEEQFAAQESQHYEMIRELNQLDYEAGPPVGVGPGNVPEDLYVGPDPIAEPMPGAVDDLPNHAAAGLDSFLDYPETDPLGVGAPYGCDPTGFASPQTPQAQEMMGPASIDDVVAEDPAMQAQELFDEQMRFPGQPGPIEPALGPYNPYGPLRPMYDPQMQQLMDPFGMMGPAPMGPMM